MKSANILHDATARSLVLMDETGRGTSIFDGLSLAWASAVELAQDLGRAQQAFESVSRKVGLYRAALRVLDDTRNALPDREVAISGLDALRGECEDEWKRALEEHARCGQELEGAEARRARFDELLGVLSRLAGLSIEPARAATEASRVDAGFRDLADRVERAKDLPQRIERAEEATRAQTRLRQRLAPLIQHCGPLDTAARLRQARIARHTERKDLEQNQADIKEHCIEHRSALELAGERITALEGDLKDWQEADGLAQQLTQALERPLENAVALEDLGGDLQARAEALVL